MQTIEERVIRAVGKIAKGKEVRADSTFEELEIDSRSASEILFEIEDEFDLDIPDEGIRNIRGVGDVARGVERLLAGQPASFGGANAEGAAAP